MSTYTPILTAIQAALAVIDQKGQQSMVDSFKAIASGDDAKIREISAIGNGLVAQHDFLLRLEKDLKTAILIEKFEFDQNAMTSQDKKDLTMLLVAGITSEIKGFGVRSPEEKMEDQINAMMKDMLKQGIGVMRVDPSEMFKDPEPKTPPPENKAQSAAFAAGAGASVGGGVADFRTSGEANG